MQSRRSFVGRIAAVVGAMVSLPLTSKGSDKTGFTDSRYTVIRHFRITGLKRSPLDVAGKPTPPELIKGIPGSTYAMAGESHSSHITKCFFNGEDASMRCGEADAVGGWARMFEIEDGDPMQLKRNPEYEKWRKQWTSNGFVNRKSGAPDPPAGLLEFIHFGHVELR